MENYKLYIHKFPNDKVYIGITSQDVNKRWRQGEGYKDQFVYKAILKYGWKNILHQILLDGLSKEQAEEKEIEYINISQIIQIMAIMCQMVGIAMEHILKKQKEK